ncbi:MAG: hypothetical protein U7126_20415 [Microcoleus sp.]
MANFREFDFIVDRACYDYSDAEVSEFFFDIHGVEQHLPDFRWSESRSNYFCTGTFFAKRGVFS